MRWIVLIPSILMLVAGVGIGGLVWLAGLNSPTGDMPKGGMILGGILTGVGLAGVVFAFYLPTDITFVR